MTTPKTSVTETLQTLMSREQPTTDEKFELARLLLNEKTPERAELARGLLVPLLGRTVGIREFQDLAGLLAECYSLEGNVALAAAWLAYAPNHS